MKRYAYTSHFFFFVFFFLLQVELANYLYERLISVPSVRVYGPMPSRTVKRAALCSFNVEDVHPTDIATFLDQQVHIQQSSPFCVDFVFIFSSFFKHCKELEHQWMKRKLENCCLSFHPSFSITDLVIFFYLIIFQHSVAIRSGHHCAQPLHRYLGVTASARASLHFYNTKEDVDDFIQALSDTINFFASFK